MSTHTTPGDHETGIRYGSGGPQAGGWGMPRQRRGRDKPFFLTSEWLVLLGTIAALVIAAAVADGFGAERVWTLVTVVAAAYIISRGIAKSGNATEDRDDR